MKAIWGGFRRVPIRPHALLMFAGPTIVLTIIITWGALLAFGWALLYWPRLPEEFSFSPSLDPSSQASFVDALYLSLMTLSTLGYGTITPSPGWLQITSTVEALVGFGLFTASLTWVVSLYPVLARRTTLAREATLTDESERELGSVLGRMEASSAADRVLESLTSGLLRTRTDMVQFPVTYYFHNLEEKFSFPFAVPHLLDLAERASAEDQPPEVRLRALHLLRAVEDFSELLASKPFLGLSSGESTREVLGAYARDHLHAPPKGVDSEQG